MSTQTQPTQTQIEETIAASGKTKITDMVSYATSKFPTVDKKQIREAAKYIQSSIPKNCR